MADIRLLTLKSDFKGSFLRLDDYHYVIGNPGARPIYSRVHRETRTGSTSNYPTKIPRVSKCPATVRWGQHVTDRRNILAPTLQHRRMKTTTCTFTSSNISPHRQRHRNKVMLDATESIFEKSILSLHSLHYALP